MSGARQAPTSQSVWAVVVLYHPEGDLAVRLLPVMRQTAGLIVVANDGVPPVGLPTWPGTRGETIVNATNCGLGAALNQGIDRARAAGAEWVLLLDQDSVADADLIVGAAAAMAAVAAPERVAVIGVNYRNRASGRTAYPTDVVVQPMATVITSGSLVSMAALAACGGMKEDFFIEGIDLEFALRVRKLGWKVVASGRPLMTHAAGAGREWRIGGRTVLIGDHPPWRCYLQVRNLTWILRHYWWFDLRWSCSTLVALGKRIVLVCLAESATGPKLRAWARGFCDGWRRRLPPPRGFPAKAS